MQPQTISRFEVWDLGNRESLPSTLDVNVEFGTVQVKAWSIGVRRYRRYTDKNSQYESTKSHSSPFYGSLSSALVG